MYCATAVYHCVQVVASLVVICTHVACFDDSVWCVHLNDYRVAAVLSVFDYACVHGLFLFLFAHYKPHVCESAVESLFGVVVAHSIAWYVEPFTNQLPNAVR